MEYKTLLNADFSALSQAVSQWGKLPEKFKKVSRLYWNTVAEDLYGASWVGDAAAAAYEKLGLVEKQIGAAAAEASDVHKLIDDAHEIFSEAQKKLRMLTADIEKDKYLSISAAGEVSFVMPADVPAEQQTTLTKSYWETVESYKTGIRNQLSAAQEADDILHWALTQDRNGRTRGFEANSYNSIEQAKKGQERADRDLEELEKILAEDGELRLASLSQRELDPKLLQRIDKLMARHEGDPYFAEKFATGQGAKGTLEFWRRVADRQKFSEETAKASGRLQKTLGHTLAVATHSDSAAMKRWKKDMVALGDEQIHIGEMALNASDKGPYGFQVMSSLMRTGEYEKSFLTDYGQELIKFEKDNAKAGLDDFWMPNGTRPHLSFGSDAGLDPMAGYMEALGRNPEAAKTVFGSEEFREGFRGKYEQTVTFDPVKYLLSEREWPDGGSIVGMGDRGKGYDELGHALEAATLGVPYDQPELGLDRDDMTAKVMTQVVKEVSGDRGYVDERPGIGNSLAKMRAGYIDDLNWSVSDFGDIAPPGALRDGAFGHEGKGHAFLGHGEASNFLRAVGSNSGGYEILSAVQHAYTSSAVAASPAPSSELALQLKTGAQVHGILDQARISDIDQKYGDATDEANRKFAEAAEWKKYAVGQGVGLGVGLATLPFGGPAAATGAAMVASFVVPAVAEGIGGAIETDQGIEIDRQLAEQEADYDRKEEISKGEFVDLGRSRAMDPLEAYGAARPDFRENPWFIRTGQDMQTMYNNGDNQSDQVDSD